MDLEYYLRANRPPRRENARNKAFAYIYKIHKNGVGTEGWEYFVAITTFDPPSFGNCMDAQKSNRRDVDAE